MNTNKIDIGQRIKRIRLEKGMTLEEFGKMLHTSKSIVSRWEKGISIPNPERLRLIAKISNLTVNELLYGKLTTPEFLVQMLENNTIQSELERHLNDFFMRFENKNNPNILKSLDYMYFKELLDKICGSIPRKTLITNITKFIIKDLIDEKEQVISINFSPCYSYVCFLFNNDYNGLNYFFNYLIQVLERLAKQDKQILEFMINKKIGTLISELNTFLRKEEVTGVLKTVTVQGVFTNKDVLIDTMDFDTYEQMQQTLVSAMNIVSNGLTDKE